MRHWLLSWVSRLNRWEAISLILVCGLTFFIRCLHLLERGHYYIVSADSHYFNRIAGLVATDDTYYYGTQGSVLPYFMNSGISYPLGLMARLLAMVTGVSPSDTLVFVGKFLPPTMAVVTVIALWLAVSHMYGLRTAFFTGLSWAIFSYAIFVSVSGYVDRDGLSLLLVLLGALSFYLTANLKLTIGKVDYGWIVRAMMIAGFEAMLYVEWGFLGPLTLMLILVGFVVTETLVNIVVNWLIDIKSADDIFLLPLVMAKRSAKNLVHNLAIPNYRPIYLALTVNIVVVLALQPGIGGLMAHYWGEVVSGAVSGTQTVGELRGIGLADVLTLGPLIVPMVIGLCITIWRRRSADIFWFSWFVVLLLASLFAKRFLLYCAPAACALSGLGLAAMLDFGGVTFSRQKIAQALAMQDYKPLADCLRVSVASLLLLWAAFFSITVSYHIGSIGRLQSADTEHYRALTWLRDNTSEESFTMTWWDYGYWIMDIAHRFPLVDNGQHADEIDHDIARVYCTDNDAEAIDIMRKYGVSYLMLSREDTAILPSISSYGLGVAYGDGTNVPRELRGSLFNRAISGSTDFGYGLKRVYPEPGITDPAVVILECD